MRASVANSVRPQHKGAVSSGEGPLQIFAEFLMAVAVWVAAVALAQFGVEVDLSRDPVPTVERVIENDRSAREKTPASAPCPEAAGVTRQGARHAV